MSNSNRTVTILLEKALSTNSDAEKLACLKKLKGIYYNEGIQVPAPPAVRPARPKASNTVDLEKQIRDLTKTVAEHQQKLYSVNKDNSRLATENEELRMAQLRAETVDQPVMESDPGFVKSTTVALKVIGVGLVVMIGLFFLIF